MREDAVRMPPGGHRSWLSFILRSCTLPGMDEKLGMTHEQIIQQGFRELRELRARRRERSCGVV